MKLLTNQLHAYLIEGVKCYSLQVREVFQPRIVKGSGLWVAWFNRLPYLRTLRDL